MDNPGVGVESKILLKSWRSAAAVVVLTAGALGLAAMAWREANRASGTEQLLVRDYTAFVADRFTSEMAKRYATLVGMQQREAQLGDVQPFLTLRTALLSTNPSALLSIASEDAVRYYFVFDRSTGDLAIRGQEPSHEERESLAETAASFRPRCAGNVVVPFRRINFESGTGYDWSGLAETDSTGGIKRLSGFSVDPKWIVQRLISDFIHNRECSCADVLLPESLRGVTDIVEAASFEVRDGEGRSVFASSPRFPGALTVTRRLDSEIPLAGWTVEIAINPAIVEPLLPFGGQGLPWPAIAVLGALVLGSGGLALWATRRDVLLNRLRQSFVSNVSHELKTPLARIRLFNELIGSEKQSNPEKKRSYQKIVDRECRRLTFLVDNVLDFSRLERGLQQYDMAQIDLRDVVRRSLEAYGATMTEERISLEDRSLGALAVKGDERALQQVVINLLDNAVKYSPDSSPIRVGLARRNGRAVVTVSDEGCGIGPEFRERIFEEFYRIENGRSQAISGSGLGLALVRRTLDDHQGRVGVVSELGQGSMFSIDLPLCRLRVETLE